MSFPSPHRVLIIDDTPANLALLFDALSEAGHDIAIAESGRSALDAIALHPPDLILLDVIMPGVDGFTTCSQIKANPAWRDIPVIFMTSLNEPEEKVRAFNVGAVDYIVKPVYPPEVLARVHAHLQIRSLQRSLEDELALRIDAENQLSASLDRALLIAGRDGRIQFATRLAVDLLHRFFPGFAGKLLPPELSRPLREPATLRVTHDGRVLLARLFTENVRDEFTIYQLEEENAPAGPSALIKLGLTTREAEVLFWVAQGKSNPDIATILGASVRTIHKHVENIFRKLGCETRAAAAITAQDILRAPAR